MKTILKIITREEWSEFHEWDKVINNRLAMGQTLPMQVTEELYYEFLEVLPPEEFGKTRASFIKLSLPIQEYFLVGEASTHVNGKPVFNAFARAFDSKYFYLGQLPKEVSLYESIRTGDTQATEDWNKRAEAGEIMRII